MTLCRNGREEKEWIRRCHCLGNVVGAGVDYEKKIINWIGNVGWHRVVSLGRDGRPGGGAHIREWKS